MKISKLVLMVVVVLTGFASCSKDKNETKKQSSIEGVWTGTYVNDASGDSFFYSFNIKAGGTIEELNSSGQKIGQGTWEIENDILTATYQWPGGSKYSVIAAFYKDQAKLLGDWGYGNSATNGGTWQMTKSN
jgi:hypothetical protein